MDRIIRKPELLQITGVSVATLYRWVNNGHFPAPVKLGPNATGWRESEVRAWLESREPAASSGAPGCRVSKGSPVTAANRTPEGRA